MQRGALAVIAAVILLCLCGCVASLPSVTTTQEYTYEYKTTEAVIQTTEDVMTESSVALQETTAAQETTMQPTTEASTAIAEVTEAETTTRETSSVAQETTTAEPSVTEVDLSVSMPEKNGTMVTDSSADNKFIQIIRETRGLSADVLVAVYAVPESGQNYVFEFYSADKLTADNIRRVYLIDSYGAVTGVAATKNTERENVSAIENWFCMNVLIKEIIFPAVSGGM